MKAVHAPQVTTNFDFGSISRSVRGRGCRGGSVGGPSTFRLMVSLAHKRWGEKDEKEEEERERNGEGRRLQRHYASSLPPSPAMKSVSAPNLSTDTCASFLILPYPLSLSLPHDILARFGGWLWLCGGARYVGLHAAAAIDDDDFRSASLR